MPLFESLVGNSPKAVARKAAALPAALTNGCEAMAAPSGDLSGANNSASAVLDQRSALTDARLSHLKAEHASARTLELSGPGSIQLEDTGSLVVCNSASDSRVACPAWKRTCPHGKCWSTSHACQTR